MITSRHRCRGSQQQWFLRCRRLRRRRRCSLFKIRPDSRFRCLTHINAHRQIGLLLNTYTTTTTNNNDNNDNNVHNDYDKGPTTHKRISIPNAHN